MKQVALYACLYKHHQAQLQQTTSSQLRAAYLCRMKGPWLNLFHGNDHTQIQRHYLHWNTRIRTHLFLKGWVMNGGALFSLISYCLYLILRLWHYNYFPGSKCFYPYQWKQMQAISGKIKKRIKKTPPLERLCYFIIQFQLWQNLLWLEH